MKKYSHKFLFLFFDFQKPYDRGSAHGSAHIDVY